jgi:hypothetical protein
MLISVHRIAIQRPDEIEIKLSELTEGADDYEYYQCFKRRQKAKLNLHDSTQTNKRIVDLAVVRHIELTTILALTVGAKFEQSIEGFVLSKTVEACSEALSIHYAIDVKPSEAFIVHIEALAKSCSEEAKRLVEMLTESCGIGARDDGPSSEIDFAGPVQPAEEEVVIPGSQSWQNQVMSQPSQRMSQPAAPRGNQDLSKNVAMSPITLNSHWSRLKSKTLRRRSTDTDLSRLVDLPPIPPRLSQTESVPSALTPKRKGVLVRIGDLSPSKLASQESKSPEDQKDDVMAWETPVKMRKRVSQTGKSLATHNTDLGSQTTSSNLVILETPPRASIGALESRREPVGRVASFQI